MLRSVKSLKGAAIRADDGDIGRVDEFYFDDEHWTVRYLVVNTGEWLIGRRVLISPISLGTTDWDGNVLQVHLTREQIRNSPDANTAKPISRGWEMDYYDYYGWPYYWGGAGFWGPAWYPRSLAMSQVGSVAVSRGEAAARAREDVDTHLRSTDEVTGYTIHASDGDLGHVEDFILDDETWAIRYLSVDTRNWLPGKKVLVAPKWIESVYWPDRSVTVNLNREQIRNAPEWDPSVPITREYEERLCDHFGRPRYWTAEGDAPWARRRAA